MKQLRIISGIALLLAASAASVAAQSRPDPAALLKAQETAMKRFAGMDGTWRGTAWTLLPSGEKHTLTQTERVGPFLNGSVKVVEGRGYEADGSVSFNALGIISYDPATEKYSMRSHAMGHRGDFAITPTENGFRWEIPAGPMILRYTATIENGVWTEVGERVRDGAEPVRFFEMTLRRIGDTDWPAAGAIEPGE